MMLIPPWSVPPLTLRTPVMMQMNTTHTARIIVSVAANLERQVSMSDNPFDQAGQDYLAQTGYASPLRHEISLQSSVLAQQAAQQQQIAAFNQYVQRSQEQRRWMIDGQMMTMREFADALFPEESAERTMFFLKYSK